MSVTGARIESLPPSQQLGKYRLVATLGQGGMGTVYLALASGLGEFRKVLVLKELRQDLTRKAGFVSMFTDEAKLTARLDHPNVVQTFEAGQEDERYYLAMEYLDGQPMSALIDRLASSNGLPLWVHIQILCEVLSGLHYAHELPDYDGRPLGVVHRDISPQNVFITYHGQVKVVDFGVAKAAGASTLTDPGVFKGKFAYAAPEQVLGRPVDARTDVFAVGVMLWEAISGRRFAEQNVTPAAFRERAAGREPRIRAVVPNLDPLLAEICDRALAVDPDARFPTAEDFRAELQEYLQLSGVRVEAPEIGHFMRDVFAQERRDIHMVIERAMKHSGASESTVEALPFMNFDDPSEATAIADLSSLVDVSNERDDDKIRRGYAHSKITLMRPRSAQPPAEIVQTSQIPVAAASQASHRWLLVSMALSGLSMAGVVGVLLTRGAPGVATEPVHAPASALVAPAVASAHSAASALGQAAVPIQHPLALKPSAAAAPSFASQPMAADDATLERATRAGAGSRRYVRARGNAVPTESKLSKVQSIPVAESAPVVQEPVNPAKPASPTEMGSELRRGGRGVDRIDMEDPYK
jgi:serine/threonine protein kinase